MKRNGSDEPIPAMGTLDKPPAAYNPLAPAAVQNPSLPCLISQLDVLFEFPMYIKIFPAFDASDFSRLEIIPDDFLSASRALYYNHRNVFPLS
jgi:hypothetical protein